MVCGNVLNLLEIYLNIPAGLHSELFLKRDSTLGIFERKPFEEIHLKWLYQSWCSTLLIPSDLGREP